VKLLLDTRLLLWAAGHPKRLSAAACRLIDDARNQLLFKTRLKRLSASHDPGLSH
jgi:PIN domain nuclease of toxin-antitoxin system